MNQPDVVSLMYCYSVRTNGEGWFRMHPPMHALYHLPNLVSHPTAGPIGHLKAHTMADMGQQAGCLRATALQRARAADPFVPAFSESDLGHLCPPPTPLPHPTLRFLHRDTHPSHHSHTMACNMGVVHGMNLSVLVMFA